jgi:hypothetical protein
LTRPSSGAPFETLAKLFSIRRTGDATTNRQSAARYADLAAKQ